RSGRTGCCVSIDRCWSTAGCHLVVDVPHPGVGRNQPSVEYPVNRGDEEEVFVPAYLADTVCDTRKHTGRFVRIPAIEVLRHEEDLLLGQPRDVVRPVAGQDETRLFRPFASTAGNVHAVIRRVRLSYR